MALAWRARAALVKGATLVLFAVWVLGSVAWHAWLGTLPKAEMMGVVGFAALLANGGVGAHALSLPDRRREHALRLDMLAKRCDRKSCRPSGSGGRLGINTGWPDVIVAAIMGGLGLAGDGRSFDSRRAELSQAATGALAAA